MDLITFKIKKKKKNVCYNKNNYYILICLRFSKNDILVQLFNKQIYGYNKC